MNIALITDNYLPTLGGVSNVMVNIRRNLGKLGEQVLVFNNTYEDHNNLCYKILSSNKTLKSLKSQRFSFYYFLISLYLKIFFTFKGINLKDKFKLGFYYCFYPKNLINRIISIKNLVTHFEKEKIDVILSGTSAYPLTYSYILSRWFKIPLVTIAHGDDFINLFPLNITNLIFMNSNKIILTNEIMQALFIKIHKVQKEKTQVIHLGIDESIHNVQESREDLRKKYNIPLKEFVILTVSRLYPRKGFETMLKALKLILDEKKIINIKYYILGGGSEEKKVKKIITDLKLNKFVRMLGDVDGIRRDQYYTLSDLFILVPEVKKDSIEGFGIVFLEANYFKLPIIGASSGGVKKAIIDGKNGLLISPGNEIELKEKILYLYQNESLRKEMGEFGHKRTIESFNWEKNIRIYQETLSNMINEN